MSPRRCRLYLITPPEIADIAAFSRQLDEALDAGDVAAAAPEIA
jgi:thiamine-phosphate pyrophosphorylase